MNRIDLIKKICILIGLSYSKSQKFYFTKKQLQELYLYLLEVNATNKKDPNND